MSARRLAALLSTAALVVVAAQPSVALAQSLSDRATARGLMEDGDARRERGDLEGALKSFSAADAIMRVPTTALAVASTQAQLGLLLEAMETATRVQRMPARPNEPAPFKAARAAAAQLVQGLAVRIPTLSVVLKAEGAFAPQLTVDGEPVPLAAAEAPRRLNPGAHTLVVTAGSRQKREEVTLAEREARTVTVELTPAPAALAAPRSEGRASPASAPSSGTAKALVYGGFAVGALGIAAGSITGLVSLAEVSELEANCGGKTCPPAYASDLDRARSLGTVSTLAFIIGGAGIATGVVGLLVPFGDERPPASTGALRPAVRAVAAPGYVGVAGRF